MVFDRFRKKAQLPSEVVELEHALKAAEKQLKAAEKEHRRTTKEQRRALEATEREHSEAVSAARFEIERRENEYKERVTEARQRLDSIQKTLQPLQIEKFGRAVLYEDRIVTKSGEARLKRGVNALADTAAKIALARPAAVTRLAADGSVDGRAFRSVKGYDARKVYLLIEADELVSLTSVRSGDEERASEFAARVNVAALNARRIENEREEVIGQALREVELAEAFHSAVDAAGADLERVQSQTDPIDEARSALELVEADTEAVDSLRAAVEERRAELEAARAAAAAAAAVAAAEAAGLATEEKAEREAAEREEADRRAAEEQADGESEAEAAG